MKDGNFEGQKTFFDAGTDYDFAHIPIDEDCTDWPQHTLITSGDFTNASDQARELTFTLGQGEGLRRAYKETRLRVGQGYGI